MNRILIILMGISFLFFGVKTFADEEVMAGKQYDESVEADFAKKAKKRQYPGGRDESDLKVQTQVTTPQRKMAPQTEIKVDEPAEE